MDNKLILSVSPHLRGRTSTAGIMLDVVVALCPALIASYFIFGLRAILITAVCVATCVLTEAVFELCCKKPVTVGDFSAVITGMLLAFNLPVSIPIWQVVIGSVIAILVCKQLFGGLGMNFANPAITARIIMLIAFAGTMTSWTAPKGGDLIAGATPLAALASGSTGIPSFRDMFFGVHGGCIGETCSAALLLGGVYLVIRKVITIHTPVVFVATVFLLSLLFNPSEYSALDYAVYQLLSGGLLLGAIFMATDYVTTPTTASGKLVFGFGCGLLTFLIRVFGSYPEGVSFSILFMNILTPYINNWTARKPLGGVKAA